VEPLTGSKILSQFNLPTSNLVGKVLAILRGKTGHG
jgi:hypothetical protein